MAPGIPDEMLPRQFAPGAELVKVTGKSCSSCRTRKVKCDRRYPECTRCIKRRDVCDYGDDVSFALRPIVSGTRLRVNDSPDSSDSSPHSGPTSAGNVTHSHPRLPTSSLSAVLPYPPQRPHPQNSNSQSRSLRVVSDFRHQVARRDADSQHMYSDKAEDRDRQPHLQQLWDRFLHQSNLGESSSDWRLALPTMASSLTLHLLEASMNSCCYQLPAFHVFNTSIGFFKQNINSLDVASQAALGVLTSLGARASPHSALLGVAGPDIENGNAPHDLVLSAGARRESAWRAIVKHATKLCSKLEILQVPSAVNAQTLVAFVQMLMFSEVRPKTARFFLRAAVGLFYDMQGGDMPLHEVDHIKRSVGPTLYESDARISAWLSLPALISEDDLDQYFYDTGVYLVDLESENLSDLLTDLFDPANGPMTLEKAQEGLRLTNFYVCAVQRRFARISSNRRATPARYLAHIESVWGYIDGAHAACQLLTGTLREFAMAQNDPHHLAHHDLLIGLRMHGRLLDIMNLSNEWLRSRRNGNLAPQDRNVLESFLGVANRRVRRCLKVLAFYAKVFHDSHDKHVVYHLFTQLEAVENWATMAAQGEDDVDEFGPLGSQCVLTETELDYFQQALELSCFYTPLSATRLKEFTRARQARDQGRLRITQISEYEPLTTEPFAASYKAGIPRSQTSVEHPPVMADCVTILPTSDSSCAKNPSHTGPEVLSGWLLSGFAGPLKDANVEHDSPSTCSLSISPAGTIEAGSSPDTNGSLAINMVSTSATNGYVANGSSFISPVENADFLAMLDANAVSLSFPTSNLTNLAQTNHSANLSSHTGGDSNDSLPKAVPPVVGDGSNGTHRDRNQLTSPAQTANNAPWSTYSAH